MKKSIFPTIILAAAFMPQAAIANDSNTALFSFSDLREEAAVWGKQTKETFDVAIRLARPEAVGKRVVSFSVPMYEGTGIENIKVWLSTGLEVENKQVVADIVSMPASIANDRLEVTFPDGGYEVPEGGLYAGYTFTITETDCQANKKPIALTYGRDPDGLFIHSTRSYLAWKALSEDLGGLSAITLGLQGDIQPDCWNISVPEEMNFDAKSESISIPIQAWSAGSGDPATLDFICHVGEETFPASVPNPGAGKTQFLFPYTLTLTVPAKGHSGLEDVKVELFEVQARPNQSEGRNGTVAGYWYDRMPQRGVLVEEYTGLWCVWCPKGYVALERMAQEPGFIGVAIHNDDAMTTLSPQLYPNSVPGLPGCWVDRSLSIDPTYENVRAAYEEALAAYSPIEVTLEGTLSEDLKAELKASITSMRPLKHGLLPFFYVLADGLEDDSWRQSNAFSGRDPELYPGMEFFIEAPEKVSGLVYNDVLAAFTTPAGTAEGFPLSEPGTVKAGELCELNAEFDLSQAVAIVERNGYCNLGEKATSFKGVFGVADAETGKVLNAASCSLSGSGINGVEAAETVKVEYFDLTGRRMAETERGLAIRVATLADGTRRATKTRR